MTVLFFFKFKLPFQWMVAGWSGASGLPAVGHVTAAPRSGSGRVSLPSMAVDLVWVTPQRSTRATGNRATVSGYCVALGRFRQGC